MPEPKTVLDDPTTSEEIDPDVERYERMPIQQVRKELQEHGIDPAPTVAAVNRLIESALAARRDPKKKR